jgi:CRP-like cAMP-binding protein
MAGAVVREFAAGEVLQGPGVKQQGFNLISRGSAQLTAPDQANQPVQIAVLGPGEFFGDHGVGANQEPGLVLTAMTDLVVIYFPQEEIEAMLAKSPALSAEVGEAIDTRRRAAQQLKKSGRKSGNSGFISQ